MKIVHVGAKIRCIRTWRAAQFAATQGHEVIVISGKGDFPCNDIIVEDETSPEGHPTAEFPIRSYAINARESVKLKALLENLDADIIQIHETRTIPEVFYDFTPELLEWFFTNRIFHKDTLRQCGSKADFANKKTRFVFEAHEYDFHRMYLDAHPMSWDGWREMFLSVAHLFSGLVAPSREILDLYLTTARHRNIKIPFGAVVYNTPPEPPDWDSHKDLDIVYIGAVDTDRDLQWPAAVAQELPGFQLRVITPRVVTFPEGSGLVYHGSFAPTLPWSRPFQFWAELDRFMRSYIGADIRFDTWKYALPNKFFESIFVGLVPIFHCDCLSMVKFCRENGIPHHTFSGLKGLKEILGTKKDAKEDSANWGLAEKLIRKYAFDHLGGPTYETLYMFVTNNLKIVIESSGPIYLGG